MAFSKLKTLIRKATARTCDQLRAAVGHVCDLFSDEECHNYFKAAGYEADSAQNALIVASEIPYRQGCRVYRCRSPKRYRKYTWPPAAGFFTSAPSPCAK